MSYHALQVLSQICKTINKDACFNNNETTCYIMPRTPLNTNLLKEARVICASSACLAVRKLHCSSQKGTSDAFTDTNDLHA